MYSYTATGIHSIHPVDPTAPKLRIRCKCKRDLIQQEIYTCISCTNYSCHFCTIPEISYFQCRNCKAVSEPSRNNKCKMCFGCPYCSNVLVVNRSSNKKFIMFCNFCGWNSQEIFLEAEKAEDLIEALNKQSATMKESQQKIYQASLGLFQKFNAIVDHENQMWKYSQNSKKGYKKNQEDSLQQTKNQLEKTCETLISRSTLEDNSEDYAGDAVKIPQNLPLLAKKTRRCPNCKKPLTTSYQTRTGEQKTELMYKDLKVLQCQRKPAIDEKVKIKCLRNLILNGQECKAHQIKEVQVEKEFKVQIQIVNRTREAVSEIEYDFVVLKNE